MQDQEMKIRIGDQYEGWVVEREVERTVLSEVWKVRHFLTGTEGVLKVIAEGLVQDQYFLEKFSAEVKILQTLKHPNILAGMGCFPVGYRYGVVTPWVEGWTLEKLIHANPGGLPLEDALPIAICILETLAEVHARNIFHRDIKPNNVLVEASTLKPFLIDFGIALVVGEPRKTKYGMVLGNPNYMSPEQIQRFHEVDSRSDIYAFGCVLFEMLTGRPPFVSHAVSDTEQLYEVQRMQIYDPPPLLRDVRSELPAQLEQVVAMALEKDPDQRYVSCIEFADFLKAVEVGAPALPLPPPAPEPAIHEEPLPSPIPLPAPGRPVRLYPIVHLFMAGAALLGLLPVIVDTMMNHTPIDKAWADEWPAVAIGAVISAIGYLILIYRCWAVLPEEETKTTGAKAVLYHFAFPYTLIAVFRYFPGFIAAYNRHVSRNELDLREYNEGLGVAWSIAPFGMVAVYYSSFEIGEKAIALVCLLLCWASIYGVLVWRMCEAVNKLIDLSVRQDEAEPQPGKDGAA